MTLPPGFAVSLFAGEPAVVQPIAMTFDDRGRLWVVECLSYPNWKFDGTGADRVTLFEDTDGDGQFDVRHVVFEHGSNLSSIELGHGGIWLCSTPNLVFIPCDIHADRPAPTGQPQIVLDGWNVRDTKHNIFSNLIWGPDGWLYGCNGIQSKSNVGPPGTPAAQRVEFNCGVWRYHPTTKKFEAVCHGTTNPFGLDYDEYGELFITNCVIKHLFHVIPGAHYDRMYGQDINPNSFGLMHSIADYIHWAGGDWTTSRGGQGAHSDAGGGHAHVGALVYLGDNFPDEYRNTLLTCNLHGNRLNRDLLKRQGSGYKSLRAPDFMFAHDPWFRGISIKSGPDGAVYVSDWTDTGECHNYEKVDATNGRIYRVTYGKAAAPKINLAKLDDEALVALQSHKNDWFARHARRLLHERAAAGANQKRAILAAADQLADTSSALARLRVDWLHYALGDGAHAAAAVTSTDNGAIGESRRVWAIRSTLQHVADGALGALKPDATSFPLRSPAERLAFASGLQRLSPEVRLPWALRLLTAVAASDEIDANLPLMTWYSVEPLVGRDAATTRSLLHVAQLPLVREFIARKSAASGALLTDVILDEAAAAKTPSVARELLQGVIDGLGAARQTAAPPQWSSVSALLLNHADGAVAERAKILAVKFGDQKAIDSMMATLADPLASSAGRSTALRVLLLRANADIVPLMTKLLDDRDLRGEAIRGLAVFNDPETPDRLLRVYPGLKDAEKQDAIATLASRPKWALALLDAIESGAVRRTDVSVLVARQIQGLKNKKVRERLAQVWGQLQPASARRGELTAKFQALLTNEQLAKADLAHGRQMFVKNCASCHKLYDAGGDIGPGLTGSQRSNLDYLLENLLDPSAVVPKEYQMTLLLLDSGRTVSGIVTRETDKSLTIRTANETLEIPLGEIETRELSKLSMMPEGMLDKLSESETRDLVAYLRGKEQVPLPGDAKQ